jgi:hypothetical protein
MLVPLSVVRSPSYYWFWYCQQKSAVAKLIRLFVVGWAPALLLVVWQGGLLPLFIYLLTQARGCVAVMLLQCLGRGASCFLLHDN